MARTSFAYRVEARNTVHVTVGVFAGADEQHRAKCGTLTFREDGQVFEWSDFQDRVLGPGHTLLPALECRYLTGVNEMCVREPGHPPPCQSHTRFITHPEERAQ